MHRKKLHDSSKSVNSYAAGGKFGQYKMMQNTWEMSETLAHGYLSECSLRAIQ